MKHWIYILLLLTPALALGDRPIPAELNYWWKICILDGTGQGPGLDSAVHGMVKMAAECGVRLDVEALPLDPDASRYGAKEFADAAAAKCNIADGYKDFGVNRGSVLAIVNNPATARRLCNNGSGTKEFCGQLGFDPGPSFKYRMGNTGYFGGIAKPGSAAFSVVSGSAINARDMSAVALGQGMMALPQGFGSGNGVGSEYEGQAAGGSNVDGGWSDYGCDQMRKAAFVNRDANKQFIDIKRFFPEGGRLQTVDPVDLFDQGQPPIFGWPMAPGAKYSFGAAAAGAAGGAASVAQSAATPSAMTGAGQFFKPSSSRASTSSASPTGHPGRTQASQVTSLRQSEGTQVAVEVPIDKPGAATAKPGGRVVSDEDAEIDKSYAAELQKSSSTGPTSAAMSQPKSGAPIPDNSDVESNADTGVLPIPTTNSASGNLLQAAKESAGSPSTSSGFQDFSTGKTSPESQPQSQSQVQSQDPSQQASAIGTTFAGGNSSPASGGNAPPAEDSFFKTVGAATQSSSRRPSSVDAYGGGARSGGTLNSTDGVVRVGR